MDEPRESTEAALEEAAAGDEPRGEGRAQKQEGESGAHDAPRYTDRDVDKLKGTAREEGRQAALRRLLKEAGAESVDELLAGYREYAEARKLAQDEYERLAEEHERLKSEHEQALVRLWETRLRGALGDALRDAGINPQRVEAALRLADTSSIEEDEEGNLKGIEEAVARVREASPEWFSRAQSGPAGQLPGSPTTSPSSGGLSHHERLRQSNLRRLRF